MGGPGGGGAEGGLVAAELGGGADLGRLRRPAGGGPRFGSAGLRSRNGFLDYWVGSLDFKFWEMRVFFMKPPKKFDCLQGGQQQPKGWLGALVPILFWLGGFSYTKIDCRQKDTLVLTSPLEDLDGFHWVRWRRTRLHFWR